MLITEFTRDLTMLSIRSTKTAHARFLRAGEEEEIFSKDFFWQSDESLKLADYVDNDSRLLREEFDRACREASEKISQRVLSSDFCPEI
jgi:hypothetical protein